MDLRQLRGFLAVAHEQSFTRAAQRLHMAQPPLSQRIRELEAELGVQLFERNTRRVALTAAGHVFFDGVRPLFAQLDQAVESCRRAARGETGQLRVGYTGRGSQLLLLRLVAAFRQRFPEVALDIAGGPLPSGALRLGLLQGTLDVALCFLPLEGEDLATRRFATTELVIALPASHPLAGCEDLRLERLQDEPFVGFPSNQGYHLRQAMDDECGRAGFDPRVVRETESSQVLLCLVAAGTGVSVVPRELEAKETVGVVFRSLDSHAHPLSHGLAWRTSNRNPALANLLEMDLGEDARESAAAID
ncbi:LysR substrate-binding domain-containing protein [Ramlibacter tataouinensis]|uniref:LysR family transcriptional regulator n=1 Tax=Ramlibacter tataouinensis TaxID=94132 RepID=UPI0022F3EA42|nr:LysR substrate-binding domain-containing protein [Ramlibacter tataouinensis]WBY01507.1 LysR substrate-binding domain-containing protein [Ramlibacter tataouinensis]